MPAGPGIPHASTRVTTILHVLHKPIAPKGVHEMETPRGATERPGLAGEGAALKGAALAGHFGRSAKCHRYPFNFTRYFGMLRCAPVLSLRRLHPCPFKVDTFTKCAPPGFGFRNSRSRTPLAAFGAPACRSLAPFLRAVGFYLEIRRVRPVRAFLSRFRTAWDGDGFRKEPGRAFFFCGKNGVSALPPRATGAFREPARRVWQGRGTRGGGVLFIVAGLLLNKTKNPFMERAVLISSNPGPLPWEICAS